MTRTALGLSPGLRTHASRTRARTPGQGQALSTSLELRFRHLRHAGPPICEFTRSCATSRRTHNCTWRYLFALGREGVLPAALGRTGGNSIPKAASLTQSATGLAVITAYAVAGWDPMTRLFFWLGAMGGLGIVVLLAVTAVAVIVFFGRDPRGESTWARLTAPSLAAALLGGVAALAVAHYHTLLGVPPGAVAAWALPAAYAALAVIGVAWGLALKARRPQTYATIGLGPSAVLAPHTPSQRTP
ncbi:MAG TPA: hypothetical protein VIV12_24485 [Streptosporangiaceae bacterium]